MSYTWRDVTDRYATAEALAASEEMYRLLTENLSDVVVHVQHGVVTWVTPSLTKTLGWAPEDLMNHELIDFVHSDGRQDAEMRKAAVYAGAIDLFRVRARAKDGSYHWLQAHVKPFYDKADNQDGIRRLLPHHRHRGCRRGRTRVTGPVRRAHRPDKPPRGARTHGRDDGPPAPHREEAAVLFCDIDGFKTITTVRTLRG